jgi:hypothetical protein
VRAMGGGAEAGVSRTVVCSPRASSMPALGIDEIRQGKTLRTRVGTSSAHVEINASVGIAREGDDYGREVATFAGRPQWAAVRRENPSDRFRRWPSTVALRSATSCKLSARAGVETS